MDDAAGWFPVRADLDGRGVRLGHGAEEAWRALNAEERRAVIDALTTNPLPGNRYLVWNYEEDDKLVPFRPGDAYRKQRAALDSMFKVVPVPEQPGLTMVAARVNKNTDHIDLYPTSAKVLAGRYDTVVFAVGRGLDLGVIKSQILEEKIRDNTPYHSPLPYDSDLIDQRLRFVAQEPEGKVQIDGFVVPQRLPSDEHTPSEEILERLLDLARVGRSGESFDLLRKFLSVITDPGLSDTRTQSLDVRSYGRWSLFEQSPRPITFVEATDLHLLLGMSPSGVDSIYAKGMERNGFHDGIGLLESSDSILASAVQAISNLGYQHPDTKVILTNLRSKLKKEHKSYDRLDRPDSEGLVIKQMTRELNGINVASRGSEIQYARAPEEREESWRHAVAPRSFGDDQEPSEVIDERTRIIDRIKRPKLAYENPELETLFWAHRNYAIDHGPEIRRLIKRMSAFLGKRALEALGRYGAHSRRAMWHQFQYAQFMINFIVKDRIFRVQNNSSEYPIPYNQATGSYLRLLLAQQSRFLGPQDPDTVATRNLLARFIVEQASPTRFPARVAAIILAEASLGAGRTPRHLAEIGVYEADEERGRQRLAELFPPVDGGIEELSQEVASVRRFLHPTNPHHEATLREFGITIDPAATDMLGGLLGGTQADILNAVKEERRLDNMEGRHYLPESAQIPRGTFRVSPVPGYQRTVVVTARELAHAPGEGGAEDPRHRVRVFYVGPANGVDRAIPGIQNFLANEAYVQGVDPARMHDQRYLPFVRNDAVSPQGVEHRHSMAHPPSQKINLIQAEQWERADAHHPARPATPENASIDEIRAGAERLASAESDVRAFLRRMLDHEQNNPAVELPASPMAPLQLDRAPQAPTVAEVLTNRPDSRSMIPARRQHGPARPLQGPRRPT